MQEMIREIANFFINTFSLFVNLFVNKFNEIIELLKNMNS